MVLDLNLIFGSLILLVLLIMELLTGHDNDIKTGGSNDNNDYISTFDQIASNYPDKPLFDELMLKTINSTQPICEKVSQIPYALPYKDTATICKVDRHIGQRKLLLSEVQFLNKSTSKYVLYAGSAPGNKTHLLSVLFPEKKFILIDPNKFDLMVNDRSHRLAPHPDIVHLVSGYPTKSNVAIVANDKLVNYVTSSDYKIFIMETYMNDELATIFKDLEVDFISDIRSNVSNISYPMDIDIAWNNCMMYNWMKIMQPVLSMIKIRMLFGTDNPNYIIPDYMINDFEKAKPDIDFVSDYHKGQTRICKGDLYIQCWSPKSSTEMRLHVSKENISNIISYDTTDIENRFYYQNSIARSWAYYPNPSADRKLGFCHCADCSLENKIWTDYVQNRPQACVRDLVLMTDKVTSRPLSKVHIVNIWKMLTTDDVKKLLVLVENSYNTSIAKKSNKQVRKNRGNTGRK